MELTVRRCLSGAGYFAGVIAIAYSAVGVLALGVAILPLFLMRKTQAAYLAHTERSSKQLREAAETIHTQNVSLEQANRLLRERSTAAMESLSATVDARDSYTAGHSRRVRLQRHHPGPKDERGLCSCRTGMRTPRRWRRLERRAPACSARPTPV